MNFAMLVSTSIVLQSMVAGHSGRPGAVVLQLVTEARALGREPAQTLPRRMAGLTV